MAPAQPVLASALAMDAESEAKERSVIRAAANGDGRAFEALVRPHLPLMFRLAARTCGHRQLAEDAVQEALSVASRELARYRAGTSLRAWLATIVVRRAHTLSRSEQRRRTREDGSSVPEPSASPSELLGAARTQRRILVVLESMPDKRREAALLRLDAGLPYAEIAAAIGSSERSVRVLVHLAIKQLREQLTDLVEPEGWQAPDKGEST